jgi:hypothetical protein
MLGILGFNLARFIFTGGSPAAHLYLIIHILEIVNGRRHICVAALSPDRTHHRVCRLRTLELCGLLHQIARNAKRRCRLGGEPGRGFQGCNRHHCNTWVLVALAAPGTPSLPEQSCHAFRCRSQLIPHAIDALQIYVNTLSETDVPFQIWMQRAYVFSLAFRNYQLSTARHPLCLEKSTCGDERHVGVTPSPNRI